MKTESFESYASQVLALVDEHSRHRGFARDDVLGIVLFQADLEEINRKLGLDGLDRFIVLNVSVSVIHGNDVDISALAALTGTSRGTVRRHVQALAAAGILHVASVANRTVVRLTPVAVAHLTGGCLTKLDTLSRRLPRLMRATQP